MNGETEHTGEETPVDKVPFTIDHLLAHLQIEADFVVDRAVVTRGQRLVLRDLLQRAHDEIERLNDECDDCTRAALGVLNMPEMQAIRRLLWVLDDDIKAWLRDGYHYTDAYDEWHKIVTELPHVAEWARSDP